MALLAVLIPAIANVVLGLFVYSKNRHSITSKVFFALTLSVAAWIVVNYLANQPGDPDTVIQWVRLTMALAVCQVASFFLLSNVFPHDTVETGSKRRAAYVLAAAAVAGIALSPYLFTSVVIEGRNISPVPGPGIAVFLLFAAVSLIGGAYWFIRTYLAAEARLKTQLRIMLAGAIGMFVALLLCNVVSVLVFKTSALTSLGSASTILFTGAAAYAIVKHGLFDIRAVVARSVAFSLLFGVISLVYVAVVIGSSRFIEQQNIGGWQAYIYGAAALLIAVTYDPLKRCIERVTDGFFYKNRYDNTELLSRSTKIMASTVKLDEVAGQTLDVILSTMRIARGAMLIVNGASFDLAAVRGYTNELFYDVAKTWMLVETNHTLVLDREEDARLTGVLRKMGADLAVTLRSGDKAQGILLLGNKLSGDQYADTDIEVLEILGPELAVAIENTRSYKQIQQFNVKLEREIAKATKQLRLANDELQTKNAQLEALDHLKDEFISITSHELRTPLTAIRGYLWMALHGKKKDDQYDLYMDRAYTSTERLIGLVNDSLDVARIESGRVELNPEPTALRALSEEVVAELASRATERHQTVTVTGGRGVFAAWCDPNKIHQVLVNLLGNALKFTPEGGAITIRLSVIDGRAVVAVGDNGPGIAPEDQAKLFQKFSRIENNLSSVPGTGLGLYLCKQIIELSGGTIGLQSAVGKGSVFSFSLPLADATARPGASAKHRQSTLTIPAV